MKAFLWLLNSTLILLAVIVYALTFYNPELMKKCFSYVGYYLILTVVILWLVTVLQNMYRNKIPVRQLIKSHTAGLLLSILLTTVIFISSKPHFRVLSDEANLLAIAKSMFYEKQIDNSTAGKWYFDMYWPIYKDTPKHPLLFPFATYLMHTLFGYRAENVFIVNYLALFAFFLLIYNLVRGHLGQVWAAPAVILVASQPILTQTATSGHFDLFACLFMVICFACLEKFLKESSAFNFQLLWVNLLMLANIRHEGVMSFVITLGCLLALRYIKSDFFKTNANTIYFITPLLLVLNLWQRQLVSDPFEAGKKAAFSADYFIKNNITFFKELFDYKFLIPFATLIDFIGVLSALYFVYLIFKGRAMREGYKRHLLVISTLCLLVNWALFTSFHNGVIDHPSISRYYIIYFSLLSLSVVAAAARFKLLEKTPAILVALSCVMFFLYHPLTVADRFSRTQLLPRKYSFVLRFLKQEARKNRDFLVISSRPGLYTVQDWGAVSFHMANSGNSLRGEFNARSYNTIYVIQHISYKTMKADEETRLDDRYKLEPLIELQNSGELFTRISKVVSIDEEKKAVATISKP